MMIRNTDWSWDKYDSVHLSNAQIVSEQVDQ